jgi:hypothetical protein
MCQSEKYKRLKKRDRCSQNSWDVGEHASPQDKKRETMISMYHTKMRCTSKEIRQIRKRKT